MESNKIIGLEEFRKIVKDLAVETKKEYPNLFFDWAGIIPVEDENDRYEFTPINTKVFARTGGDGVHYSLLEISDNIQPIIMTVPMHFGDSMKDSNWIIGENLSEFLSIGFYNGWFPIEQLCYDNEGIINFYANEDQEYHYQKDADIQFVKKLRKVFGYSHIPLKNERLKELEDKYFQYLQFDSKFV